ncbi:MAG: hypothetical protein V4649_01530 [Bacteroidota bacterium]
MKKFILRLILFCLLPLPLLLWLSNAVDKGLRQSRHFYYSEWNDVFNGKANADMLVMGSSRAWVQISPRILDSALHLNSYNLGMDGSQFNMQYERFKIYLQHNKKPKYILQEVGYTSTLVWFNELPTPQQFLPYLHDSNIWYITQKSASPFTMLDRYFPLYKYNNELPLIREGLRCYFGKGVAGAKYKGYEGKVLPWDSSFHNFKQANPEGKVWPIDPQAVKFFREYLDFCKANGIKVIMIYPPAFIESLEYIKNKDEILAVYNKLSAEYGIPFYNYMYDSLNYSRSHFYNSLHLNKEGSEIFTRKLAEQLRKDL